MAEKVKKVRLTASSPIRNRMASRSTAYNHNADLQTRLSITASNASTYQTSHSEKFDNPLWLNDPAEPRPSNEPPSPRELGARSAAVSAGPAAARPNVRKCSTQPQLSAPCAAAATGASSTVALRSCHPPHYEYRFLQRGNQNILVFPASAPFGPPAPSGAQSL